MSNIPLDVQRRCEQRWAARFSRPAVSVAPRNQRPDSESRQVVVLVDEQKKHRVPISTSSGLFPFGLCPVGNRPPSDGTLGSAIHLRRI